jgi:Tol biopolymer transport system component
LPPGAAGFSGPAWSHDGKLLAVVEHVQGENSRRHLLVVPLEGGAGRRITSDEFWSIGEPEWLMDGSGLLATGIGRTVRSDEQFEYEGKYPQLWEFPYANGSPHRMMNDFFRYFGGASLSGDSSVLATVASDLVSAVWVGPASDPDRARAVTALSGHYVANKGLTWTGAGKILYWTNASDTYDLIVMDADGGNPHPLPRRLPWAAHPDACPDGHTLVYTGAYANKRQVVRQDLNGGRPQSIVAGGQPQCSPDSKWVVYYDNKGTAIPRKVSMEGGESVPLTEQECHLAGISPDGRWVGCVRETSKLAIIPFSGGTPVKLFDLPPTFGGGGAPLRWTPDSQSVVYPVNEGGFENLWAQPVAGGPRRALTHFTSQTIGYFAFSRDGKQIAISRGTPSSDVVVISNFR